MSAVPIRMSASRMLPAIVLIACLLFGSGFAFYAMFAAIAVELIGAVYYTFQLK